MNPEIRRLTELAIDLMYQHGLSHWSLEWQNSGSEAGNCRYGRQVIDLSAKLMLVSPPEEQRDTILHEIAHALAGPLAGHGPVWKATALAIGAKPQATYRNQAMSKALAKWEGKCARRHEFYRQRLTTVIREKGRCPRDDSRIEWRQVR